MNHQSNWQQDFQDTLKNRARMNDDALLRNEIPWIMSFIASAVESARDEGRRERDEEIERVAQFAFERLCFADYPTCETVYANTDKFHEVISRIRSLTSRESSEGGKCCEGVL
jgi:hypothetical protein